MTELLRPTATVDTYRLSRDKQEITGTIAVKQLERLDDKALNPEGEFHFKIKGMTGKLGWPGAYVDIKGTLELKCSRCDKPMKLEIDREVIFRFAKSEAEADSIPLSTDEPEDAEVIVGGEKLNILNWIEEEILLSIPYFPTHEGPCPEEDEGEEESEGKENVKGKTKASKASEEAEAKPNPFAKLKELKGLRKADQ